MPEAAMNVDEQIRQNENVSLASDGGVHAMAHLAGFQKAVNRAFLSSPAAPDARHVEAALSRREDIHYGHRTERMAFVETLTAV